MDVIIVLLRICEKLCPTNNIIMKNKKPTWNQNCEQCFGCIQWCPDKAIEYKNKTIGRKRYHNPHITISEMFNQQNK